MACPTYPADSHQPSVGVLACTENSDQTRAVNRSNRGKRRRDLNPIAEPGEDMEEERRAIRSKADFVCWAGIGPELAEFVTDFIEKPEIIYSMSSGKRQEFENQMDAILSSFRYG